MATPCQGQRTPGSLPAYEELPPSAELPPWMWAWDGRGVAATHLSHLQVNKPRPRGGKQLAQGRTGEPWLRGHPIVLKLVMIFEAGQGPVLAQGHLEMDSLYSRCPVPMDTEDMAFSVFLCPSSWKPGPEPGLGMTPSSLVLGLLLGF